MEKEEPEDDRKIRRERFGTLPARVLPTESVDTRTVQGRPPAAMSAAQVDAVTGGG